MTTYNLAGIDAGIDGLKYNLAAVDVVCGGLTYDLAALDVYAGSDFAVTLGPNPPRFDPFDVATLTASALSVPDSWVFTQLSGKPVLLSGSDGTRSYRCPGRLAEQTLVFQVTATLGSDLATAEVTHTIAPHAGQFGPGGVGWQFHPIEGA